MQCIYLTPNTSGATSGVVKPLPLSVDVSPGFRMSVQGLPQLMFLKATHMFPAALPACISRPPCCKEMPPARTHFLEEILTHQGNRFQNVSMDCLDDAILQRNKIKRIGHSKIGPSVHQTYVHLRNHVSTS